MPEPLAHPDVGDLELGEVLAALADPLRRFVVVDLALHPAGFEQNCTAFGLPVTKATRTHHFRTLRQAGLIRMRDHGNQVMTSLRREDLDHRFPGLLTAIIDEGRPDLTKPARRRCRTHRPPATT